MQSIPPREPSRDRQPLREILKELFWLSLAVKRLVGLTVPATLLSALAPGSIAPEDGLQLLGIVLGTFPFCVAAAVITAVVRTNVKFDLDIPPLVLGIIAVAMLAVGMVVGIWMGHIGAEDRLRDSDFDEIGNTVGHVAAFPPVAVMVLFVAILATFAASYGAGMFASATLIGVYAGYVATGR
jgi:hypothetical protein